MYAEGLAHRGSGLRAEPEAEVQGLGGRLCCRGPFPSLQASPHTLPKCGAYQDVEGPFGALLVLLDGGKHGKHKAGED